MRAGLSSTIADPGPGDRPPSRCGSRTRSLPHMYCGALCGIGLRFAQHLVGEGGGVTLTEENVIGEMLERITLGPAEVDVWALAGHVADGKGDGGDGVGHRG